MIAIALLLLAIAIGCAAMWKPLACLMETKPRWAVLALLFGSGAVFGIGATSISYFIMRPMPVIEWILELVVLGWLVFEMVRAGRVNATPSRPDWITAGALLVVLALGTFAMMRGWDLHPMGNWDAWSIWNLRAKFLPAGPLAWSPLLANTHPEYPLLLSSAVARAAGLGSVEFAAQAIGYAFFLALIAIVTGGVAIVRGSLAGLMTGLTLVCTATLIDEAWSQYADVPIAAFFAAAIVFVLIDRPIWAGVFAGLAMWTKDEGALFCALLLVAVAIFNTRHAWKIAIGMLPGAAMYAYFKIALAPHVTGLFASGAMSRLMQAGRWGVVLGGVLSQIVSLGASYVHPILILIAFAIAVKLRSDSKRDAYMMTALAAAMIVGYCLVMVAQPNDVLWQTNTAAGRLVLQWWPVAIVAIAMWLRPAEEWIEAAEVDRPAKKKRK